MIDELSHIERSKLNKTVVQREKNCTGNFTLSQADTNKRKRDLIAESNFRH